jgi:hypothetical protein
MFHPKTNDKPRNVRFVPFPGGNNVRRETLQINELLDEREGGRDHGLRGDKLYYHSVADQGNVITGRTHRRENCTYIHNPVSNKHD